MAASPDLAFIHVQIILAHALFTHVDAYCAEGLPLVLFILLRMQYRIEKHAVWTRR